MRFLVVGASGFIGSHILNYIQSMGYEAIGTQCQANVPGLISFDLLKDKIENSVPDSFFDTKQPVFAIICAAVSQIDQCLLEREVSYKINVENTILMLQTLKKKGVMSVFLSTSAVYDGDLGYYNEDSPHAPICEYGRHKEAVEQFLQKETPNAYILRLEKIVADDPIGNHMFSGWLKNIQNNESIVCIDQTFSSTFVKDIAKAVLLGCQMGLAGAYNVSNSEVFTRVELARQFMATLGKEANITLKSHEELNFTDPRLVKSYFDPSRFIRKTEMQFTTMREVIQSFLFYSNLYTH